MQRLNDPGRPRTLKKYSPHAEMSKAGDASVKSAKILRQAEKKLVPKSRSVTGLLGWGLCFISSLSLRERYRISSHRGESLITGPRRLSFPSSLLILLREHPSYLASKKPSAFFSGNTEDPTVPYFPLR